MKFEPASHEFGAGDVDSCENLGATLSWPFQTTVTSRWSAS